MLYRFMLAINVVLLIIVATQQGPTTWGVTFAALPAVCLWAMVELSRLR